MDTNTRGLVNGGTGPGSRAVGNDFLKGFDEKEEEEEKKEDPDACGVSTWLSNDKFDISVPMVVVVVVVGRKDGTTPGSPQSWTSLLLLRTFPWLGCWTDGTTADRRGSGSVCRCRVGSVGKDSPHQE